MATLLGSLGLLGCELLPEHSGLRSVPSWPLMEATEAAPASLVVDIRRPSISPKTHTRGADEPVSIAYELPEASDLSLELYDEGGQILGVTSLGERPAGRGSAQWDPRGRDGRSLLPGPLKVSDRRLH